MRAAIFANGEIEDYGQIAHMTSNFQTVIAVDGGLQHCLNLGFLPDLIIGDMDSADKAVLETMPEIKQVKYPKEKDESDLELALDYCNFDLFEHVTIFGGLGGYQDHTLGNLFLLPRFGKKLSLASDQQTIQLLEVGENVLQAPLNQRTFSLMPIYGSTIIESTVGLKWSMDGTRLDHHFVSLSNYCELNEIRIEVKENMVLGIFSNREEPVND